MNYPRNCSASGMFVFNDIPSFMELWRNYIYGYFYYCHISRIFFPEIHTAF